MGPPSRSAWSSLWKRLCRNGAAALRFGGTLLTSNQRAAPTHRALPFNYPAAAASGGRRRSQRGCHRTAVTHKHSALAPLAPHRPSGSAEPDEGALGKHGAVPPLLPAPPTGVPPAPTPGPGQVPERGWRGAHGAAEQGDPEHTAPTLAPHARGKHDSSLPKPNRLPPRERGRSEPATQQGEKEARGTARKNT